MVEELKSQTREVLESLTDEQVQMVLAYARQVRDMEPAVLNNLLEALLEHVADLREFLVSARPVEFAQTCE